MFMLRCTINELIYHVVAFKFSNWLVELNYGDCKLVKRPHDNDTSESISTE